jgi:hypothetical protein
MFGSGYNDHRMKLGYPAHSQEIMMQSFYDRAHWCIGFALWPRRCAVSQRWCWMNYHYCGTAVWTGADCDAVETHWHHHDEHLFWTLKGTHGRYSI